MVGDRGMGARGRGRGEGGVHKLRYAVPCCDLAEFRRWWQPVVFVPTGVRLSGQSRCQRLRALVIFVGTPKKFTKDDFKTVIIFKKNSSLNSISPMQSLYFPLQQMALRMCVCVCVRTFVPPSPPHRSQSAPCFGRQVEHPFCYPCCPFISRFGGSA